MRVLWDDSPQPAYDVIQHLAQTEDWRASTVKTLLARLYRKKALGIRRYKNLFLYYPLISEGDCLRSESESFLERFFGGSVKTLLVHFVEDKKLTTRDIDELRKLLDRGGKSS